MVTARMGEWKSLSVPIPPQEPRDPSFVCSVPLHLTRTNLNKWKTVTRNWVRHEGRDEEAAGMWWDGGGKWWGATRDDKMRERDESLPSSSLSSPSSAATWPSLHEWDKWAGLKGAIGYRIPSVSSQSRHSAPLLGWEYKGNLKSWNRSP